MSLYHLDSNRRANQEPLVVGDQRGIVVVWPDQHRARFSWLELRQACPCAECRQQREEQEPPPLDALLARSEVIVKRIPLARERVKAGADNVVLLSEEFLPGWE
jgi:hypothetical protein